MKMELIKSVISYAVKYLDTVTGLNKYIFSWPDTLFKPSEWEYSAENVI